MKRLFRHVVPSALVLVMMAGTAPAASASEEDSPAARQARWADIEKAIFGDRHPASATGVVTVDAPSRAEDAALVPVTVTLNAKQPVKGLYFVIDDNPSPVAAHFTFGPAADPHVIKLRVRVNSYTDMHAVAELSDGSLVQTAVFIKAAGGCSAPMGMSDEQAMQGMGEMRLKFASAVTPDKPAEATLMVRHPNFNGMQMNQLTRFYTPARYIDNIEVSEAGKKVFTLATGISLAMNPVITFGLIPEPSAQLKVTINDSDKGHWEQSFAIPMATD